MGVHGLFDSASAGSNQAKFTRLRERKEMTEFVTSGDLESLEKLLKKAKNVNELNEDKQTVLHTAAQIGATQASEIILKYGGRIDVVDCFGMSPLSYAVKNDHTKCSLLLLDKGAKSHVSNKSGKSPLMFASENGNEVVTERLIFSTFGKRTQKSITFASQRNHNKCVKAIFDWTSKSGSFPKTALVGGMSLASAAGKDLQHGETSVACSDCMASFWSDLGAQDAGICANSSDLDGNTAAHYASASHSPDCLEIIVQYGYGVSGNELNGEHRTPLLEAARRGYADCVEILLRAGADPTIMDEGKMTAVMHAAQCGSASTLEALVSHLGEHTTKNRYSAKNGAIEYAIILSVQSSSADCLRQLLKAVDDVNDPFSGCGSALIVAAAYDNTECITALVERGIDINVTDTDGKPVISFAAEAGALHAVSALVGWGTDVNAGDEEGWTPMHYAAAAGEGECVALLLSLGANPNLPNDDFKCPLTLAMEGSHAECIRNLIQTTTYVDWKEIEAFAKRYADDWQQANAMDPDDNRVPTDTTLSQTPFSQVMDDLFQMAQGRSASAMDMAGWRSPSSYRSAPAGIQHPAPTSQSKPTMGHPRPSQTPAQPPLISGLPPTMPQAPDIGRATPHTLQTNRSVTISNPPVTHVGRGAGDGGRSTPGSDDGMFVREPGTPEPHPPALLQQQPRPAGPSTTPPQFGRRTPVDDRGRSTASPPPVATAAATPPPLGIAPQGSQTRLPSYVPSPPPPFTAAPAPWAQPNMQITSGTSKVVAQQKPLQRGGPVVANPPPPKPTPQSASVGNFVDADGRPVSQLSDHGSGVFDRDGEPRSAASIIEQYKQSKMQPHPQPPHQQQRLPLQQQQQQRPSSQQQQPHPQRQSSTPRLTPAHGFVQGPAGESVPVDSRSQFKAMAGRPHTVASVAPTDATTTTRKPKPLREDSDFDNATVILNRIKKRVGDLRAQLATQRQLELTAPNDETVKAKKEQLKSELKFVKEQVKQMRKERIRSAMGIRGGDDEEEDVSRHSELAKIALNARKLQLQTQEKRKGLSGV